MVWLGHNPRQILKAQVASTSESRSTDDDEMYREPENETIGFGHDHPQNVMILPAQYSIVEMTGMLESRSTFYQDRPPIQIDSISKPLIGLLCKKDNS